MTHITAQVSRWCVLLAVLIYRAAVALPLLVPCTVIEGAA